MRFLSKLFTREVGHFVGLHILLGMAKANGITIKTKKEKGMDVQCVRLTKDHAAVTQMVSQWCGLRKNKLQQFGMTPAAATSMAQMDARFLNALSHAIATQNDQKPAYDGWLFFDGDVQNTCFFELVQCTPGSKDVRSTMVIRTDR